MIKGGQKARGWIGSNEARREYGEFSKFSLTFDLPLNEIYFLN